MDNDRGGRYEALVSWQVRVHENARLVEPVGYPDMQRAMGGAEEMLADYWGVPVVPCGALRGGLGCEGWVGCGGMVDVDEMANDFEPDGAQRDVFGSGDASEKIAEVVKEMRD